MPISMPANRDRPIWAALKSATNARTTIVHPVDLGPIDLTLFTVCRLLNAATAGPSWGSAHLWLQAERCAALYKSLQIARAR
jgi:hypothetical protein